MAGPSWAGDFEVRDATDVETLTGLACIAGNLRIEETDLVELSLPALMAVGGELTLAGNTDLLEVEMQALTRVGTLTVAATIYSSCALVELVLPALETVDNRLAVVGAEDLVAIELPALTDIGEGGLAIHQHPFGYLDSSLVTVDLPVLARSGSVQLWAPLLEVLSLPSLEVVDHSFQIAGVDELARIEAPMLRSVGGQLKIESGALLSDVELPALAFVGLGFRTCGTGLTTLDLPTLTTVGTNWEPPDDAPTMAIECETLQTLNLPSLSEVGGSLLVVESHGLSSLELPSLSRVGAGFGLRANQDLATLEAPRLETVGWGLSVFGNASLEALDLPAIVSINSVLDISGDLGPANRALTRISMPSLERVGSFLRIAGSNLLTTLDLDALVALGGDLLVLSNDSLPTCEAEALRDQLRAAGWTGDEQIVGNDDTGTCE